MKGWLTGFLSGAALAAAQTAPPPAGPGINSQAPDGAPPGLRELRARLAESLTVADRAATTRWMAAVMELEKARAAAGDYEGARRARDRRERALAAAGTSDGRMPVALGAKNLTNKGPGLVISETQGTVTFRNSGSFIEWDATGEFNGWYEVLLTHGVVGGTDRSGDIMPVTGPIPDSYRARQSEPGYAAPAAGGWVALQNMSSLGRTKVALRREIVSTGGWNAWRTVSLGRMELSRTRIARLRLSGEEVAREGLMHFRQLELVPIPEPFAAAAGDGEARLAAMRETFRRNFRSRITSSAAAYKSSLTALEQQALRSKDNDLLFRVRDEVKRLQQAPEELALSSDEALAAAPVTVALPAGHSFGTAIRGDIVFDSAKSSFTKLKPAGTASITWRLSAFNAGSGTYEVALHGVVPVTGGGSATLAAFGESSTPAGDPLRIEIKPVISPEKRQAKLASGENAPVPDKRTEEPGKLVIAKGAQTLTLTVNALTHPDGWLMDLASLTLTRTGAAPENKTP